MHSVERLHSTKYVAERIPQYFSCAWAVWFWIKSDSISNAMPHQYMRDSINRTIEIRSSSKDCRTSTAHQGDWPNCTAVHGSLSSKFNLLTPYYHRMSLVFLFPLKKSKKHHAFPSLQTPQSYCIRTASGLWNSNGVCSGPVSDSFAASVWCAVAHVIHW